MMDRRNFLKLSAAAPLTAAFGKVLAQSDTIELVCPVPLSGPFAANGKFSEMGVRLAVENYGKLLGKRVTYTTMDTEGKPATAVRKVQEAAQQKGARFFVGGILSSEALAMSKEVDKAGGVYMTIAGADEITGSDCNRSTFRWSVPTYGIIDQTVRQVAEKFPNAKRWYTITPQYVFGEGLLHWSKEVFKAKGIEHVGNSSHSLAEKEFSGYLTNAMAARPDVLLLLNFASQSSDTLRQAVSFGIKKNMIIVVAQSAGLEQFESLGPDICDGVYFGLQNWHGVDTPFNREFVRLANGAARSEPNFTVTSTYTCARVVLDAIKKANSTDPKAVIAAMEGMQYEGPTGIEEIRRGDHQVIKDFYLLKGKPKAAMKNKSDYGDIVSSGKSFLPVEKTLCKMA